ncbi:cell surface protein, partial [Streptococcus pneumoniae]|nr:cell surface protein [Streptococcus pneumoniae]
AKEKYDKAVQEVEVEKNKILEQDAENEKKIDVLQNKVADLEKGIAPYQNKVAELNKEIARLQSDLKDAEENNVEDY